MKYQRMFLTAAIAAAIGISAASFAQTPAPAAPGGDQRSGVGQYFDDTVISNTIRARVIGDNDLTIRDISVETNGGVVQLSGFVDNAAMKSKAERIVRSVDGVREIHNNLIVK